MTGRSLDNNEAALADLRTMALARWPQKRIAAVLGVHQSSVSEALRRHRIPHVGRQGRRTTA
jgi:hypothetical protein